MISVVVHSHPSGHRGKVVRERNARGLSGGPTDLKAWVGPAVGPHICTGPV